MAHVHKECNMVELKKRKLFLDFDNTIVNTTICIQTNRGKRIWV